MERRRALWIMYDIYVYVYTNPRFDNLPRVKLVVLWTGHMMLRSKRGWVYLLVDEGANDTVVPRAYIPELDPGLNKRQILKIRTRPNMLLQYCAKLKRLYDARGMSITAIRYGKEEKKKVQTLLPPPQCASLLLSTIAQSVRAEQSRAYHSTDAQRSHCMYKTPTSSTMFKSMKSGESQPLESG